MRQIDSDIDIPGSLLQRIEKLRKGLPIPGQSRGHHGFGNILYACHDVDQRGAILRTAWSKAHTAVADNDGGDAVTRGGVQTIGPGCLTVIMGVDVDEPGSDQRACGIDLLGASCRAFADGHDTVARNGHIGGEGLITAAIDDQTVANDQIGNLPHGAPSRIQRGVGASSVAWIAVRL